MEKAHENFIYFMMFNENFPAAKDVMKYLMIFKALRENSLFTSLFIEALIHVQ
jgi:hypothetical protein